MPATIWINLEVDVIVPRGFWNLESFRHFIARVQGRVRCVGLDVAGRFWKENLMDYCRMRDWALNGVHEVLLYDSSSSGSPEEKEVWRPDENLYGFRKRGVAKRELSFEPLAIREEDEGDSGEAVREKNEELDRIRDVKVVLMKLFDVIEGSRSAAGDDNFAYVRKSEFVKMKKTAKENFKRPVISL